MGIDNTSKIAEENPMLMLALLMGGGGGSAGIERMEADGQRQFVGSDLIPTRLLRCTEADLAAAGFTLGPPVAGDPVFRSCHLPPGWRKEATDHSMWSKIVDETGRERFAVFYKAAPYDRSAHLSPSS